MDEYFAVPNSQPKISIIVVCRNAAATIEATFTSIISQTYKNYEIIVIDGASSDGTQEIIKKYERQLTFWVSEPDKGIYNAMNKGIKHSTGNWFYFLNANDTLFDNNVFMRVAKTINRYPEIEMIYGDVRLTGGEKHSLEIKSTAGINQMSYFFNFSIWHQAIFYNEKIFQKTGLYNENYHIVADWEHLIRSLAVEKIPALHIPVLIANFDISGVSANHGRFSRGKRERIAVRWHYFKGSIFYWLFLDAFCKKIFNSLYKNSMLRQLINKRIAAWDTKNVLYIQEEPAK